MHLNIETFKKDYTSITKLWLEGVEHNYSSKDVKHHHIFLLVERETE